MNREDAEYGDTCTQTEEDASCTEDDGWSSGDEPDPDHDEDGWEDVPTNLGTDLPTTESNAPFHGDHPPPPGESFTFTR